MTRSACRGVRLFSIAVLLSAALPAFAQLELGRDGKLREPSTSAAKPKLAVTAVVVPGTKDAPPTLRITADIAMGWHTYSLTQETGGPKKSLIKLDKSSDYEIAGAFKPDPAPQIKTYPEVWEDLPIEEHKGRVTWSAPLKLADGVDVSKLKISGAVNAQLCEKLCEPSRDFVFTAVIGAAPEETAVATETSPRPVVVRSDAAFVGTYKHDAPNAPRIRGHIEPAVAAPGSVIRLVLTAEPSPGWHIYALGKPVDGPGSQPAQIALTETSNMSYRLRPTSVQAIPGKPSDGIENPIPHYPAGPVTWTVELQVPQEAAAGEYPISGVLGLQSCEADSSCDSPRGVGFTVNLAVGEAVRGGAANTPVTFSPMKYAQVTQIAKQFEPRAAIAANSAAAGTRGFDSQKLKVDGVQQSLPLILLFALVGGFIMNFMPCVLPVIGLKVLSFVEQAHHDRRRVFMLNVWYSLGLVSVFLGFAIVAIVARLGFGEQVVNGQQFANPIFNISLTALMFVMGLSLLGVWEIPIPGFLGTSKANELAAKNGAVGAFAKGAITTMLAMPCLAPFLGTAVGFALDPATPAGATLLVAAVIGLGMAFPFLVIGGFPRMIRFLPKPGAWMETFKHLMGFMLLASVVALLTTHVKIDDLIPTVSLLIGLWAACWWIGRTPWTATKGKKLQAWATAVGIAGLAGWFSFSWLADFYRNKLDSQIARRADEQVAELLAQTGNNARGDTKPRKTKIDEAHKLPWQSFTTERLSELTAGGKTVFVDFTADWCYNCKILEAEVLNTPDVKSFVEQHGIVPLLADYTDMPPEIHKMITLLKSGGVPLLAIFPASNPNEPIVFRDMYTQQMLIDALKKAGPSVMAAVEPTRR